MGTQRILIDSKYVLGKLEDRHKCSYGNHVIVGAVQDFDGNISCEQCFEKEVKRDNTKQNGLENKVFKDRAREREVRNLMLNCLNKKLGCLWQGTVKEYLDVHKEDCPYKAKTCETCGKEFSEKDAASHFEECTMLSKNGKCLFEDIGCKQMDLHQGQDITSHINKNVNYHMNLMMIQMTNLMKSNKELTATVQSQDKTIKELTKKNEDLESMLLKYVSKSKKVTEDLDLRFQLHENSTNDGILKWKIDNYEERRLEAIQGTITALHSAPCFTSQYGYKFCLRAYLNGDGLGKNSHLSLFLVIMRSEYDNILTWPFNKKVKFTLINQMNREEDLTEVMIPDPNSSSFKKPTKEMNIASGCPLFISLDRLGKSGFLKDDSIFVKVQIE